MAISNRTVLHQRDAENNYLRERQLLFCPDDLVSEVAGAFPVDNLDGNSYGGVVAWNLNADTKNLAAAFRRVTSRTLRA
jgi:hypothetical protein